MFCSSQNVLFQSECQTDVLFQSECSVPIRMFCSNQNVKCPVPIRMSCSKENLVNTCLFTWLTPTVDRQATCCCWPVHAVNGHRLGACISSSATAHSLHAVNGHRLGACISSSATAHSLFTSPQNTSTGDLYRWGTN